MSTNQRKKKFKNDFEKDFFLFISNVISEKNMGNVRKHTHITLVTAETGRNYFV